MLAYILIFCIVNNAAELWQRFREGLSEDFIHQHQDNHQVSEEDCFSLALLRIEAVLLIHGKRLSDFGLPEPNRNLHIAPNNRESVYEEELGFDSDADVAEFQDQLNSLTPDQRVIFERIMSSVNNQRNRQGRNLFFFKCSRRNGKNIPSQHVAGRSENSKRSGN